MNSAGVVTPLWWWWRIQARILGVSSLLLCSPSACSPTLASGWALGAIKPGDWVFRPTHTGRYGLSSCVETQDDRCPAFKQLAPCLLLRLLVCDDVDYCLSLPAFAYDSVVVVYMVVFLVFTMFGELHDCLPLQHALCRDGIGFVRARLTGGTSGGIGKRSQQKLLGSSR